MRFIGHFHAPAALPPGKELPVPAEFEAERAWTFWRIEKSLAPAGIWTSGLPACNPITTLTELSRLPILVRYTLLEKCDRQAWDFICYQDIRKHFSTHLIQQTVFSIYLILQCAKCRANIPRILMPLKCRWSNW